MIELLFDFLKVLLLILVIVLTTIASYATSSLSYAVIGRHFDKEMAIEKLMKVGFVGAVFDRVLSIGGIPGLSIRLILNSKFGIRVAKSWRMIALQFYSYRVLSLLLLLYVMSLAPAKLSELYDVNGLEKSSYIGLIFVALLVLAAFIKPLRERFNALVSSMRDRLTKRLKIDFETSELEENVSFSFGKVAPKEYAIFAASVIGDWVFITMCLYAIFLLLGVTPSLTAVAVAVFVGTTIGGFTPIPGGLGVMDAFMVATFALFGINAVVSVVAVVIFRVVYYLLPLLVSLSITAKALKQTFATIIKLVITNE